MTTIWCDWQERDKDGTIKCLAHLVEGRVLNCPYKTPEDHLQSTYPCSDYEECSELTQACLKLARKIRNENPTPKTMKECRAALAEEMADVRECMNALIHSDSDLLTEIDAAADQKLGRWLDRIVEGMKES